MQGYDKDLGDKNLVRRFDLFQFSECWSKFDREGTGLINANELKLFIKTCPQPLGFGQAGDDGALREFMKYLVCRLPRPLKLGGKDIYTYNFHDVILGAAQSYFLKTSVKLGTRHTAKAFHFEQVGIGKDSDHTDHPFDLEEAASLTWKNRYELWLRSKRVRATAEEKTNIHDDDIYNNEPLEIWMTSYDDFLTVEQRELEYRIRELEMKKMAAKFLKDIQNNLLVFGGALTGNLEQEPADVRKSVIAENLPLSPPLEYPGYPGLSKDMSSSNINNKNINNNSGGSFFDPIKNAIGGVGEAFGGLASIFGRPTAQEQPKGDLQLEALSNKKKLWRQSVAYRIQTPYGYKHAANWEQLPHGWSSNGATQADEEVIQVSSRFVFMH